MEKDKNTEIYSAGELEVNTEQRDGREVERDRHRQIVRSDLQAKQQQQEKKEEGRVEQISFSPILYLYI